MAGLKGYDGNIVIEESEAKADIDNIKQAVTKLQKARELLNPAKIDDACMAGTMRAALDSQLNKLCADLKKFEESCGSTNGYIKKTVEKYQRIDREVAEKMRG